MHGLKAQGGELPPHLTGLLGDVGSWLETAQDPDRAPALRARIGALRPASGLTDWNGMILDSALARVSSMLGVRLDWIELQDFLPPNADPRLRRSALASSFVAALELARLGKAELAQEHTFGPLMLRRARA